MYSVFETVLLYNFILFLSLVFVLFYEKSRIKLMIFIPYVLIFLLSALRYDIGYDYANSARSIMEIVKHLKSFNVFEIWLIMGKEPMMFILSLIFSQLDNTFAFVLSCYCLVFIIYIYRTFNRYDIHFIGIFILFVLTILFQLWDWIRQGVALSIFLYSFNYIENRQFKKYLLCILFASLWHYSAIILLVAYPLAKIQISRKNNKLTLILIVIFIMTELQMFNSFFKMILQYIPYYNEVYLNSTYSDQDEFKYYSLPFIMYSIWYIFIVNRTIKINITMGILLFIGSVLFMISSGNLLLDRIAWFFTSIQLISVPCILKKKSMTLNKLFICIFLCCHFLYFNRQINNGGLRGSSQYNSVFSYEYEHKLFKTR